MIKLFQIAILTATILACDGPDDRTGKEKANLVIGTITSDVGADQIFFHDCYCNLEDTRIILHHVYLGGMHGGQLTTIVSGEHIDFDLSYWPYDFQTFSFDEKMVKLTTTKKELGDTISGVLILSGQSQDRDKRNTYKLDLKGNFKCALKDSSYNYMKWYHDLLRSQSIPRLKEKLKSIEKNPDSIITELNFVSLYIDRIPNEITRIEHLQKLNLNNNEISTIDLSILEKLDSLRELHLARNKISKLPEGLSKLSNLEVVDLHSNPIGKIPDDIYRMTNLQVLDIGESKVNQLSRDIKQFRNLVRLDISGTHIKQIPVEIFNLPKLQELSLPDTFELFSLANAACPSLKKLRVSHEFLKYNRQHLKKLQGVDTITVTFVYKDKRQEGLWRYNNVRSLREYLPNTKIIENNYLLRGD